MSRGASRSVPFLLAVSGGGLLALAGEPWSLNPAAFLGLSCLLASLERAPDRARPVVRAASLGLSFGIAVNGIALFALVSLLEAFGHFPAPLALLTGALAWAAQALPYAAACALTEACRGRGIPRWIAFPPALVCALSYVPQLFAWRPAATQVNFSAFVQMADLGGEPLLDLVMAVAASSLFQAARRTGRERLKTLGITLTCLVLPCAYGVVRLPFIEAARAGAPHLRIGVVQSNVGIEMKGNEARSARILKDLRTLTAELETQGAELTVWAETAYPYPWLRSRAAQPADDRRVVGDGVRGPVLAGAVTYTESENGLPKYNSAWLVRADGTLGDRVDKSRLLAFGEYVPLWDYLPPLRERFPVRGFDAGENDVIRSGNAPLGMLICYEDLFFELARKVVQRGAQALVNMTNDAWFGESYEPLLHDMVARMRAIETRRDLVRVVNTGVSSFSTAAGQLVVRTKTFERASFVAHVRLLNETTPYVAVGDWVSPLSGLALFLAVLVRRLRSTA